MRILLSNDDGYRAPGILALVEALKKDHEVVLVAPMEEQSGVGHGFTFLKPLASRCVDHELKIDGVRCYAVSGTPADCVKLGAYLVKEWENGPDIVIAGINRGANLGTDVLYSGTASAAMEGAILGIPALAVSSCGGEPAHYDSAARYVLTVLEELQKNPMQENSIWNLNVPDRPFDEIRGIALAHLALRRYKNSYEKRLDPRGRPYFWLTDWIEPELREGTDEAWIERGYATVTPIRVDITDYAELNALQKRPIFAASAEEGGE